MKSPYLRLAIVISINAVVMFLLTYTLIDTTAHFYANINRIYMALIMVMPMILLMLLIMRPMYTNQKLNMVLYIIIAAAFILFFTLARYQIPVGDEQFLYSMIPHHSSAILMCEQSSITDPQIIELCGEIIATQKREIREMESILQRY